MGASDRVVINKLRLRSTAAVSGSPEGRALAERVKQSLEQAELAPREMPPAAVLFVRRIESSIAGRLGGRYAGGPGAAAWEAELESKIGRSYFEASRVAGGEVPEDSEAVLFRDPAEMTAALLLDVARGAARDRWWWRSAVEESALRELPRAFARDLRLVPAAVSYLAEWGRAEEVALALSPGEAREIAAHLCREFGLAELVAFFRESPGAGAAGGGSDVPGGPAGAQGRGEGAGSGSSRAVFDPGGGRRQGAAHAPAPGTGGAGGPLISVRRAGEVEAKEGAARTGAAPPAEAAEGAADPGRVGFGRPDRAGPGPARGGERPSPAQGGRPAVGAGEVSPGAGRPGPERAGPAGGPEGKARGQRAPGDGARCEPPWNVLPRSSSDRVGRDRAALFGIAGILARSPRTATSREFAERFFAWWREWERQEGRAGPPGGAGGAPGGAGTGGSANRGAGSAPGPGASAAGGGSGSGGARPSESRGAVGVEVAGNGGAAPGPPGIVRGQAKAGMADLLPFSAPGGASKEPWSGAEGRSTALGGVLYLINAMRKLKLPACFEADWRLSSGLGPWGCLAALGVGLIARSRTRELLLPPERIWADPVWGLLAELEGRDAGEPLGAGMADPGAFQVPEEWARLLGLGRVDPFEPQVRAAAGLAQPAEPAAPAGLREEAPAPAAECPFAVAPALRRWLAGAVPYAAFYIRKAAAPLAGPEFDPAALLFVEGTIYVTRTHVDLVADLEQISLAARIAGLDADPGWDPLFARVVQFHFR